MSLYGITKKLLYLSLLAPLFCSPNNVERGHSFLDDLYLNVEGFVESFASNKQEKKDLPEWVNVENGVFSLLVSFFVIFCIYFISKKDDGVIPDFPDVPVSTFSDKSSLKSEAKVIEGKRYRQVYNYLEYLHGVFEDKNKRIYLEKRVKEEPHFYFEVFVDFVNYHSREFLEKFLLGNVSGVYQHNLYQEGQYVLSFYRYFMDMVFDNRIIPNEGKDSFQLRQRQGDKLRRCIEKLEEYVYFYSKENIEKRLKENSKNNQIQ